MSLIEILGAVTLTMTLASVAIISAKDSLQAGQRSAVQRELQSLNTALNNYKAAGGTVAPGTPVEDVIALLQQGVKMSDSDYAPLVDDPDLTKRIGDKDYNLAYDDITGFSYVPDGEGAEFAQAGAEAEVGVGGYPFDPSNAEEALAALAALQGMNPNDPAFGNTLEALNAAYAMGNLTDAQMQAAGLVNYNGTWMGAADARLNYAGDAADALAAGGTWGSLNQDLQRAYANVYPQDAVQLGKAAALNLMDRAVLTPQLVSGYVNDAGTWKAPYASGGGINSSTLPAGGRSWTGWGREFPIVRINDPLEPAEVIGYARINAATGYYNSLAGTYYNGRVVQGVQGVSMQQGSFISQILWNSVSGYSSLNFSEGAPHYDQRIKVLQPW